MVSFSISEHQQKNLQIIKTTDVHTEGEPLRIVTDGFPKIKGKTILEKRRYAKEHLDHLRQALIFEPRGHADMYGALITEPERKDSDYGVLFIHNEGYSSMCGHAILALTTVASQADNHGWVNGEKHYKVDTPAGQVIANAVKDLQGNIFASFKNIASWAEALDCKIEIEGIGIIKFDIGFGGAYYAFVDADKYGIKCTPDNVTALIELGKKIKQAVSEKYNICHPLESDLSFLYGTIFTSKKVDKQESHSKHVCIFADGEVDRSPTGTGVSARVALLKARNEITLNQTLSIESIVGGSMTVTAISETDFFGKQSVIPEVTGTAYITGRHEFIIDENDPFKYGFLLR
ncbi:proline racemase [Parashewanella curva]|uniref:trans-L-3-hydroxyproline dehydratase n=1 Tax=Parashewanella curva TaxID=2338552 RepID=A0A3L8PR67_9GAMM|nr:proline racemase family protein [Parashewanella curva]RLV57856.1 proline racemase [Parashewanella curva]